MHPRLLCCVVSRLQSYRISTSFLCSIRSPDRSRTSHSAISLRQWDFEWRQTRVRTRVCILVLLQLYRRATYHPSEARAHSESITRAPSSDLSRPSLTAACLWTLMNSVAQKIQLHWTIIPLRVSPKHRPLRFRTLQPRRCRGGSVHHGDM